MAKSRKTCSRPSKNTNNHQNNDPRPELDPIDPPHSPRKGGTVAGGSGRGSSATIKGDSEEISNVEMAKRNAPSHQNNNKEPSTSSRIRAYIEGIGLLMVKIT